MTVRIRLSRLGGKKRPHHRIVVVDSRKPRDGKFIEELGVYDPSKDPAFIKLDKERIKFWLNVGAKPSETVASILKKEKVSK